MPSWSKLFTLAQAEVKDIIIALPPDLRRPAEALPVLYEKRPGPGLAADGIEPDTLGLFVGGTVADPLDGGAALPSEIILFLENIWEWTEDQEEYRQEIRATYLHELGHYLGLDETDLTERGLD